MFIVTFDIIGPPQAISPLDRSFFVLRSVECVLYPESLRIYWAIVSFVAVPSTVAATEWRADTGFLYDETAVIGAVMKENLCWKMQLAYPSTVDV
jgi:hypothetical protein